MNHNALIMPTLLWVRTLECKATKLTLAAQFGDDPVAEARTGYQEMVKAVVQLWRYFSNVRRGIVAATLAKEVIGLVVTLDMWLAMSPELTAAILEEARHKVATDPDVTHEDCRPIAFSPISELEYTLSRTDTVGFFQTVKAASSGKYSGWALPAVLKEIAKKNETPKPYPFALEEVLPWWHLEESGHD